MVACANTNAPIVIKIGGSFFSLLEKSVDANNALLNTISDLHANHKSVVIVHGGGDQVLRRLNNLGITSSRKDGLRVTPDSHMPIVTSVLAGELNKSLVAECAKYTINAVGISLADGNMATCHEHPADIGAVGVPTAKSANILNALFKANMVPIVASVGKDDNGRLYNVNADHAAICVAKLLSTKLYFFTDVSGVLDKNKQVIPKLDSKLSKPLVTKGIIKDGMTVKVEAAQFAANEIQQSVTICSWDDASRMLLEHELCGTEIQPDTED